jgi:hypothetical protein
VLSAALMIALAAVLLFFLFKPKKRTRTTGLARSVVAATPAVRSSFQQAPRHARLVHSRHNLAYQRIYVDHSFIRP